MNKLPSDIKYNIASWIFNQDTIIYLKNNDYNFKPNLHKYTLKLLIDDKKEIFNDLVINGLYDNNYYWVYNFQYKENTKFDYYKDLLFLMVEKNIKNEEYFNGLIKSNKKNLNLIDKKSNTIALYNYIYRLYSENLISDLINNHTFYNIDDALQTKNILKCIEMCFTKKYDLLLMKIIQAINAFDNNIFFKNNKFFENKINYYNYEYLISNFPQSIAHMYKSINPLPQSINSSNVNFYLYVTNLHFPKDYEKILKSTYLYNYGLNKLYIVLMYILSNTNTDLSNEIFNKIDFLNINNKLVYANDSKYYNDILLTCLITSYESIIYGTYIDDLVPLIINVIISHYKLKIKNKNINDFVSKIKPIISKLIEISDIDHNKEEFVLRVIENSNEEYAKKIIDKLKFSKLHFDEIKSNIINLCLDKNLNNLIIHLIVVDKIKILKLSNLRNEYNCYKVANDFYDSFLELLFKKNKNELIMKIVNNDTIKINKSKLVFAALCLSTIYNKIEIFIELLKNYKQYINVNKLLETFYYSENNPENIIYYIIKNKMDNYLDLVMCEYFLSSSTQISLKISKDSIISLLIEYGYSKYVEKYF